jgi:hypothetical protein
MDPVKTLGKGLSFEEVWAITEQTALGLKQLEASMQETDLQMKETDRRMQETDLQIKETGRQMKETDRRLGKITNRFGEVVEYTVVPNLVAKFRELKFEFTRAARDVVIADRKHNIFTEIDAFLENGDKAMIVEIKTKPTTDDINYHIERMEKLRAYADFRDDKRKYLGAIAGVVISESVSTYALKKGFYLVEPSGETFKITEPKGEYHPHEW